MNKIWLLIIPLAQACSPKPIVFKSANETNPLCGDSVIWCIDLHNGFMHNNVAFIVDGDSLGEVTKVHSFENECTEVRFACVKDGSDKNKMILCNYSTKVERSWVVPDHKLDSVKVDFFVDGDKYTFAFSKKSAYRFYGISILPKYHQVGYLPSKTCIVCF